MKEVKRTITVFLVVLIAASQAYAWPKSKKTNNQVAVQQPQVVETPLIEVSQLVLTPISKDQYENFDSEINKNISAIQALFKNSEYGNAYSSAQNLLAKAKDMAGIEPYTDVQSAIFVSGIIPKDIDSFSALSEQQQDKLKQAANQFRGGYFLSLLNLLKRAQVLNTRTLYHSSMETNGRVTDSLKKKLLESLIKSSAILITFYDTSSNKLIKAYDSSFVSPDFAAAFDDQLIVTAMDLQLVESEAEFVKLVNDRLSKIPQSKNGVGNRQSHAFAYLMSSVQWGISYVRLNELARESRTAYRNNVDYANSKIYTYSDCHANLTQMLKDYLNSNIVEACTIAGETEEEYAKRNK